MKEPRQRSIAMIDALRETRGDVAAVAERFGVSHGAVYQNLLRRGLSIADFRPRLHVTEVLINDMPPAAQGDPFATAALEGDRALVAELLAENAALTLRVAELQDTIACTDDTKDRTIATLTRLLEVCELALEASAA